MVARPGYVWTGTEWVLFSAAGVLTDTKPSALFPENYGAVGDGVADDQAAIAACLAAVQPGQTIVFAAGSIYRHSSYLEVDTDGVTLTGGGWLLATDPENAALKVTADHVTVDNLVITLDHEETTTVGSMTDVAVTITVADLAPFPAGTGWKLIVEPGTSRREQMTVTARNDGTKTFTVTRGASNTVPMAHASGVPVWNADRQEVSESHLVYQFETTGCIYRNLLIRHSDAAGFLSEYSSDYFVEHCRVTGGLADSFHNTHASTNFRFTGCRTYYGGDDGFAVVSYDSAPSVVSQGRFDNCRVVGNGARGFSVVGGTDIAISNCHAEYTAAAGFYVACEGSFSSYGVDRVTIEKCTTLGVNTSDTLDHGSLIVYNGRGGAYTIANVTFRDMTLRNTNNGASAELLVVGYNTPTADKIRYENVRAYDGPASLWNNNFTPTNWLKDVTQTFGYTAAGDPLTPILLAVADATSANQQVVAVPSSDHRTFNIIIETKGNGTSDIPAVQFNGDAATHYTSRHVEIAATGTTLTSTELTGQTEARLGSVSHTGERLIELNFTNQTLNCTGVVTQARSPRSTGNASGAMEIAGRIQWYQGGYNPLTQVRVFNVGGNNFNYVRAWVYAFPDE